MSQAEEHRPSPLANFVVYGTLLLVGLIGCAALFFTRIAVLPPVSDKVGQTAISDVTITQLEDAHRANEIVFERDFVGKRVRLIGVVSSVRRGSSGPEVVLKDEGALILSSVVAELDAAHAGRADQLRQGHRVTVTGVCRGKKLFHINLDNASFSFTP